jgi:hypothetical protein
VVSSCDKQMNDIIRSDGSVSSDVTWMLGSMVILHTKQPVLGISGVQQKSRDQSGKRADAAVVTPSHRCGFIAVLTSQQTVQRTGMYCQTEKSHRKLGMHKHEQSQGSS